MKQKLIALGAVLAVAALFAARIPSAPSPVSAYVFADDLNVQLTACSGGDPSCGTVDTNVQVGESVTTKLHTGLANNEPFYHSVRTITTGLTPSLTVPQGDTVGTGAFDITLNVVNYCGGPGSGTLSQTYAIYAASDPVAPTPPALGYAKGLTGAETWGTGTLPPGSLGLTWVADFQDNDHNNISDPGQTPIPAGPTTPNSTRRTLDGINFNTLGFPGLPDTTKGQDGVYREPLYMPTFDLLVGQTHNGRSFGNAVVAANVSEVPVDFVTFTNYPAGGQTTQVAVIGEGAALTPAILPPNPSGGNTATCPPFASNITTNNKSSSGALVQTATGTITYDFQLTLAPDVDGDGIPGFADNCDQFPNAGQADTADNTGIGDGCDSALAPGTPVCPGPNACTATDWDGDGYNNYLDSCPFAKSAGDTEGDGLDNACDPAPAVEGDGYGYPGGPGGGAFAQSAAHRTLSIPLPAANGTFTSVTETLQVDSNNNHLADGSESVAGCPTSCRGTGIALGDSDGDGSLDTVDADALDPGDRATKCAVVDCDIDLTNSINTTFNNIGDGCAAADEPGITIGGIALDPTNPWDFYNVPSPALFASANPTTVFRGSGTLSAAMAQSVFAYFKKGAKLGTQVYNQDLNMNNVMDGIEYDRKVSGTGPPIGPDGTIAAADAQKQFSEVKQTVPMAVKCVSAGGYKLNDSTWRHP